jgi:hypothetical protein
MQAAWGHGTQRDGLHLLGRGHLEIEGDGDRVHHRVDIRRRDVAPILPQMRRDPVGARSLGHLCCAQGSGIGPAAGVAQRRDMVDVDPKPQLACLVIEPSVPIGPSRALWT